MRYTVNSRLVLQSLMVLISFICGSITTSPAEAYDIGVYYFPGWNATSEYWNDLKGLPGSRSSGIPWPEREPLLGFNYPEENRSVAEQHITWASQYGITFFAYDWYWDGNQSPREHALKAHLRASNKNDVLFCLLWANHTEVPNNILEFDLMVDYWIANHFNQSNFYFLDGKPVVFIFSPARLDQNAHKFGQSAQALLARANSKARSKGYQGVYFVAVTNEVPSSAVESKYLSLMYSAYTGWNYVITFSGDLVKDYNHMVDTYLKIYEAAAKTAARLPYFVAASPGWDSRPWHGKNAHVRENSTPEKFERMLIGAKKLLDIQKTSPKILMIEAWNEFGEGAYIEPTKKWGMQYLETIQKVFGPKR